MNVVITGASPKELAKPLQRHLQKKAPIFFYAQGMKWFVYNTVAELQQANPNSIIKAKAVDVFY